MINADPLSWPVVLSQKDQDLIILKGPLSYSLKQRDYPRDSKRRIFPLNVFHQSLPNKETLERDFLGLELNHQGSLLFPLLSLGLESSIQKREIVPFSLERRS